MRAGLPVAVCGIMRTSRISRIQHLAGASYPYLFAGASNVRGFAGQEEPHLRSFLLALGLLGVQGSQ